MRHVWHQENGKLVPGPAPRRPRSGMQIIADIKPYKALDGTVIGSRREHRAYLSRKGLIEVGNEKAEFMKPRVLDPSQKEIEASMQDAIEQCRAGKGTSGDRLDPQIAPALDLTQVEKV